MATVERAEPDALRQAAKPAEDALRPHPFHRGKVQILPKCAIRSFEDFAVWYTPGVAASCLIAEPPAPPG